MALGHLDQVYQENNIIHQSRTLLSRQVSN